jgi:hypothetical protein
MKSWMFWSSILDVGSSANRIFGLFANTLIGATRCRSPLLKLSKNLWIDL